MRNFLSSRRALSTVVSGMIILVATAMLGSAVVSWSNGSFSTSKVISAALYTTNVNALNEKLVIENVYFGCSNWNLITKTCSSNTFKFLNITMYNAGSPGITFTDIKITNSTGTKDVTITKGNILSQKTNSTQIPYNWSSTTPLSIIVTTSRGSVITSNILN
jgi:hypothetical protein